MSREALNALHQTVPGLRVRFRLPGHAAAVNEIDLSPDGLRLATASNDGTARVWDAATGAQLLVLDLGSSVETVDFSPARVYVLPVEQLISLARARLTRTWTADECRRFLHLAQCPAGP